MMGTVADTSAKGSSNMKSKLLGFGAFFCPIYVLLMAITIALLPLLVDPDEDIPVPLRPVVVVALILLFVAVVVTGVLMIYDIVHVGTNTRLSGGEKAAWICALWFLSFFVIPVYWLKYQRHQ